MLPLADWAAVVLSFNVGSGDPECQMISVPFEMRDSPRIHVLELALCCAGPIPRQPTWRVQPRCGRIDAAAWVKCLLRAVDAVQTRGFVSPIFPAEHEDDAHRLSCGILLR